jgi:beta-glucosidase
LNSGKEIWNKYFVPRHAYNYGIGVDRTKNVIWRIEHKEFDGVKAKNVVLKIGK